MKKIVSVILVVTLIFSLSSTVFAEDLNEVGTFPIAKVTTPLSILMQQDVLVEDYDTNAFTLWLEEMGNIDIVFDLLPAGSDGSDKLAMILSSGEQLADVVNVPMSTIQDFVYGSAGLFIDLTEYYATSAYYINLRMEEWPDIDTLTPITVADGNIYSIPNYYNETIGLASKRLWLNMEFLKALNLEIPANTDEFYTMLKAIKESDPNRNGKDDEIPLLPANLTNLMGYLMNAFIYCNPSNNYYTLNDGVVGVCYTEEAFKEGLLYMRKLCEEGLLSPLTFSQTYDQFKATVSGDGEYPTVGAFVQFSTSMALNNYANNPFTAMYQAVAPLTGPDGFCSTEYTPTVAQPQWHITSYCENPELAFRIGDLMMSEESFLRNRIGEPGVHWEYAEPGLPCYFPDKDAKFTFVSIWNDTQNSMWRNNAPGFSQDDLDRRYFNYADNPVNATYTCAVICPAYLACVPGVGEFVPSLIFTPEEIEDISEIKSTLQTYVNESIARFIVGDLDIDKDWNTFQSELQTIGLEDFLAISQVAYDRMSK